MPITDVPAEQLVLCDARLEERIAVAQPVERRLRIVVRHAQQEGAAVTGIHRPGGDERAGRLQLLAGTRGAAASASITSSIGRR